MRRHPCALCRAKNHSYRTIGTTEVVMASNYAVVRSILARHLGRYATEIRPWQHVEHDLDMTPLELTLIAAELEDAADIAIAADDLARVATVGDLVCLVGEARTLAEGSPRRSMSRVAFR
jgi:acyl carrier protein